MTLKQADYKKRLDATNKKASSQKFVYVIQTPARQFEINWEPVLAQLTCKSRKNWKKANVNENLKIVKTANKSGFQARHTTLQTSLNFNINRLSLNSDCVQLTPFRAVTSNYSSMEYDAIMGINLPSDPSLSQGPKWLWGKNSKQLKDIYLLQRELLSQHEDLRKDWR